MTGFTTLAFDLPEGFTFTDEDYAEIKQQLLVKYQAGLPDVFPYESFLTVRDSVKLPYIETESEPCEIRLHHGPLNLPFGANACRA